VKAGLNILLSTYQKLYVDDWCLPTGNLRDNRREARRADLIIITKCPSSLSKEEQYNIQQRLQLKGKQQLLFATLDYGPDLHGKEQSFPLSYFVGKAVTLVTGIAIPLPLTEYLKSVGVVFKHKKYPDHHFFTKGELEELNKEELIITTEKDFVRLEERLNRVFYIPVRHLFLGQDADVLHDELNRFMRQSS